MSIKTKAIADIISSAISTGTLGEEITIDGVTVVVVKSVLDAEQRAAEGVGLNDATLVISCDVESFTAVPVAGQQLNIDGEYWNVLRGDKTLSLLKLVLHRYTS